MITGEFDEEILADLINEGDALIWRQILHNGRGF